MKSSEGWSFCPYQGEGIRLAYFLGWRVFLESLQKSLQTTLWFPGCYKSVRFYKCTLRWLLSWAVSAQYVCAFTWFSLNSPSVSKLTSFKIVCMWQGCAFCLSSMQSSIQNVHDRSLPLPSVVFGLGSVLLCASMHLSEGFFFFFSFLFQKWFESLCQCYDGKVPLFLSSTSSRSPCCWTALGSPVSRRWL